MAVINLLKDYNIVFIHIPKTAGSSIRRGFFKGNFEKKVPETFPKEWESMFKFTFVRNPFDRFVSNYKMFTSGFLDKKNSINVSNYKLTIDEFFELSKKDLNYYNTSGIGFHTYPQTHKLNFLHKADFIGRFENLEEDFKKVCELCNIKYDKLPKWNETERLHYREYYSNKLREKITDYYREDLETLNYEF
jgi:hypothetical protein